VIAGAETSRSLAGASRYCAGRFRYSSPLLDPGRTVQEIAREVRRKKAEVLVPVADQTLIPVLQAQEHAFQDVLIPFPSFATVLRASDKFSLFQRAAKCEIPIPQTIFVQQPLCRSDICSAVRNFPVIVKPARSIFVENNLLVPAGVSYVYSKEELLDLIRTKTYLQRYPFLIQERVFGTGVGYFALLQHGKPLAQFSHRRVREKPPCGGVSVFSESIPVRPDIKEYSLRLLRQLGWSGIAMVEFKLDRHTDIPKLMEINGRFWGSLQLAIDAGVDFPALLINSLSNGSANHEMPDYRPHQQWRWLLGDLDNVLLRVFKSDETLSLAPGHPSRMKTLLRFLLDFRQRKVGYDALCGEDPRPFLFELGAYVKDLLH